MSVIGIVALIVLGIFIGFLMFVFGVMLGYYACYAKAYEEAENNHAELTEAQKKLIEVLKSQNIAYKNMFNDSCDVEVENNSGKK